MEDQVIFAKPFLIWLHQYGSDAFQSFADNLRRLRSKVHIPYPPARQSSQLLPATRKGQFEDQTQYSVVVILHFALEPLASFEHERLQPLHHRRSLIADITRSRLFWAWRLDRTCTDKLL